jgi:hypothetical protein
MQGTPRPCRGDSSPAKRRTARRRGITAALSILPVDGGAASGRIRDGDIGVSWARNAVARVRNVGAATGASACGEGGCALRLALKRPRRLRRARRHCIDAIRPVIVWETWLWTKESMRCSDLEERSRQGNGPPGRLTVHTEQRQERGAARVGALDVGMDGRQPLGFPLVIHTQGQLVTLLRRWPCVLSKR